MHGHGAYHLIERLLDEALAARQRGWDAAVEPASSSEDLVREIKLMYARGDIRGDIYHRLMEMARSGQLGWGDLARVREEFGRAAPTDPPDTPTEKARDGEIVRGLNRLYAHRARLEEARAETEQVLRRLEADVARLREQAEEARQKAQRALPDEDRARAYLAVKQEVEERIRPLEERIASLHQSLRRIETLQSELAAREAELKALESGERLAELEASIRQDLLRP